MPIDWFTVGAQALNFIILVALMKHFLYKPILDAIDAREKRIAGELADADQRKADAQKDGDEFRRKSVAFDQQRAALLAKATADAQAQRSTLLADAHQAADALAAKRREDMAADFRNLEQALLLRARTEVFAVARRALADLASASLEASACDAFILRLRALDGPAKAGLATALKSTPGEVLVRSAFELPAAQRAALRDAIDDVFATKIELRCETAPELVGGIELSAQGRKLAWSIDGYLAALEHGVESLLEVSTPAAAAPAPAPPAPAMPNQSAAAVDPA